MAEPAVAEVLDQVTTAEPAAVAIQVQLLDQVLLEPVAAVELVGQTVDLVDLVVAEMEQIMLVTVVIVGQQIPVVAVAETGTQVVDQVVLDKL